MELDVKSDLSEKSRIDQLKMVYLLMSIGGDISHDDLECIKQLAKDMDLPKDILWSTIDECKEILGKFFDEDRRQNLVYENIYSLGKEKNKSERVLSLWLLVDTAFYDEEYSKEEKRLIRKLAGNWEIKDHDSIIIEMEDTADALLDLEKYKEWIKTANYPYDYTNSVVEELDKNKQELANNIALIASIG